jgi:cytochrome P450
VELDEIFGDRTPSQWDYDIDLPKLFGGLTGAIMNEELRLVPPVVMIPKSTQNAPQPLTVNGKECMVPPNVSIGLNGVAVHRNPKYWPHGPARSAEDGGSVHPTSNVDNDLEEFKPERWFLKDQHQNNETKDTDETHEDDDLEVNSAPDTASSMFRPPKGAYIPFSEGFRACIGRRFAQVEILATLAMIYKNQSVELSVDAFVSEEEVKDMDGEERKKVWLKAKKEAERKLQDDLGSVITLQFRGEGIKVRVCPRGNELFF